MWVRARTSVQKANGRASKQARERANANKWICEQMNGKQTRARLIELYLLIAYIYTHIGCVFVCIRAFSLCERFRRFRGNGFMWFVYERLFVCVCAYVHVFYGDGEFSGPLALSVLYICCRCRCRCYCCWYFSLKLLCTTDTLRFLFIHSYMF